MVSAISILNKMVQEIVLCLLLDLHREQFIRFSFES